MKIYGTLLYYYYLYTRSSHVVLSPCGLGVSTAGRLRQVCAYTTSSREAIPVVTDGHQVHKKLIEFFLKTTKILNLVAFLKYVSYQNHLISDQQVVRKVNFTSCSAAWNTCKSALHCEQYCLSQNWRDWT
jgi:hypothetical protein